MTATQQLLADLKAAVAANTEAVKTAVAGIAALKAQAEATREVTNAYILDLIAELGDAKALLNTVPPVIPNPAGALLG